MMRKFVNVIGHCRITLKNKFRHKKDSIMDDNTNLNDIWTSRWNDRYSKDEFAYGEEPNNYLKEQFNNI